MNTKSSSRLFVAMVFVSTAVVSGIAVTDSVGVADPLVRADECVVSGPLYVAGKKVYPGGTYCAPIDLP